MKLSTATSKLYAPCSLTELPERIFSVVRELLDCEHLCYNEFNTGHFISIGQPIIDDKLNETFGRLAHEHPSINFIGDTKAEHAVKISDILPQQKWERTELFNEFFRKLGIHHQLAFMFTVDDTQVGFAANRGKVDFSERDRFVLSYLMPHLRQVYENAKTHDRMRRAMDQRGYGTVVINNLGEVLLCTDRAAESIEQFFGWSRCRRLPDEVARWAIANLQSNLITEFATAAHEPLRKITGNSLLTIRLSPNYATGEHMLTTDEQCGGHAITVFRKYGHTAREAEVLSWVAQGKSNPEIAIILNISAKTVAHHVEKILARIGVESRGAASAWAQETLRAERMNFLPSGDKQWRPNSSEFSNAVGI